MHDLEGEIFSEERETVGFLVNNTTTGVRCEQRRNSRAGDHRRWKNRQFSLTLSGRGRRRNEAVVEGDAAIVFNRRREFSDAGVKNDVVEIVKRKKKRVVHRRRERVCHVAVIVVHVDEIVTDLNRSSIVVVVAVIVACAEHFSKEIEISCLIDRHG